MLTELHFAMDARSSALDRVGSYLMPSMGRYDARLFEDQERAFVTLKVPHEHAETLKLQICRLHPTVRFVRANRVAQ